MLLVILIICFAVAVVTALVATAFRNPGTSKEARAAIDAIVKNTRTAEKDIELDVADVRKSYLLSAIPWLNQLLSKIRSAATLRLILEQADLKWTPARLLLTSVAVWIVGSYLIYLRMDSGWISMLLALPLGALPLFYVLRKRRRRFDQFQKKLPQTLDMMVSALRAGHSMSGALGAAAQEAPEPVGREFRLCFEEQNFGIDLRTAAENLVTRVPLQELRIITTAMLINKESGGNLAEVLEKSSTVIRDRFRIQQQIRVHTAQGRLTGTILGLMPVVLATVFYFVNPDYIKLLFSHPTGHKMMAVGLSLNCIGFLIIRKIIHIRV